MDQGKSGRAHFVDVVLREEVGVRTFVRLGTAQKEL
jgi:hypothetical protein